MKTYHDKALKSASTDSIEIFAFNSVTLNDILGVFMTIWHKIPSFSRRSFGNLRRRSSNLQKEDKLKLTSGNLRRSVRESDDNRFYGEHRETNTRAVSVDTTPFSQPVFEKVEAENHRHLLGTKSWTSSSPQSDIDSQIESENYLHKRVKLATLQARSAVWRNHFDNAKNLHAEEKEGMYKGPAHTVQYENCSERVRSFLASEAEDEEFFAMNRERLAAIIASRSGSPSFLESESYFAFR